MHKNTLAAARNVDTADGLLAIISMSLRARRVKFGVERERERETVDISAVCLGVLVKCKYYKHSGSG
jgi:hypothetical protein